MSSEKCSKMRMDGFHRVRCSRNGKVERGGKWYCKQHDPVAVEERRVVRQREWEAKWEADREADRVAAERRAREKACAAALSGVPDPAALLGEVRRELGRMAVFAERVVRSRDAHQCQCLMSPGTCLQCVSRERRDAARALLQRLPGGGE